MVLARQLELKVNPERPRLAPRKDAVPPEAEGLSRLNIAFFFKAGVLTLLPLALALSAGLPVRALDKALTPGAMSRLIQKAGILSPGYGVTVSIIGQEATVSTYLNRSARDLENDCKIDAVLIARQLFAAAHSNLARVKVVFNDASSPGQYWAVTVTTGDIKAYGSRQLSMQQLLSSLELTHGAGSLAPPIAPALGGKPGPGTATALPPGKPSTALAITPPAACPFKCVPFSDPVSGLSFLYPSNAVVTNHPNKDTVVNIDATLEGGRFFDISLNVSKNPTRLQPDVVARLAEEFILKSLPSFRRLSEGPVMFGTRRDIPGFFKMISLESQHRRMRQLYVYFLRGDATCTLSFTCPDEQFDSLNPIFTTVLASVTFAPGQLGCLRTKPLPEIAG